MELTEQQHLELNNFFASPKIQTLVKLNKWDEIYAESEMPAILTKLLFECDFDPFKFMTNIPQDSCNGLDIKTYSIPTSVQVIYKNAFADCDQLTSIDIPNNVNIIYGGAFLYCPNLVKINIPSLEHWCDTDIDMDVALFYAENSKLYVNNKVITDLNIPDSVPQIKPNVFTGLKGISSIRVGNNVTRICHHAFSGTSANTVYLPRSLKAIDTIAFGECFDNLQTIYYEGTKNEWAKIKLHSSWVFLSNRPVIICKDGEIQLTT